MIVDSGYNFVMARYNMIAIVLYDLPGLCELLDNISVGSYEMLVIYLATRQDQLEKEQLGGFRVWPVDFHALLLELLTQCNRIICNKYFFQPSSTLYVSIQT